MPFRLRTFGGLSLTGESGPVTGAATQRRKLALLAVLATGRERGVSRDRLLTLFWSESDAEHARHALTQSLSALRRELGSDDLFLGSADLSLNPALIDSDVAALEMALARSELERAVALYVGPFLDGIHLDHAHASPEFERWVEAERSRLAGLIAEALERLAVAATERSPKPPPHTGADVAPVPAARSDEAPAVEPSASPRPLVSRWRWLPLGLGLATVGAVAGGALLSRSHARPVLDPNLVAVAPFDVLDPRFELWHEGLVDYLSERFDRARALRAVAT